MSVVEINNYTLSRVVPGFSTIFVGAFLSVVYGFAFSHRCVFATWRVLASVALTRDRPYYNIYCSRLRLNLHGEWGIN